MAERATKTEAASPLERSLLDRLLADSRLCWSGKKLLELLDFVVRLRNFAPFNAMLLQIQKPGLSYAATATDWEQRFGRTITDGARPLLILWPFGPVALVYDVQDTEGEPLPDDVWSFRASGDMSAERMETFARRLGARRIACAWIDAGDHRAGSIQMTHVAADEKDRNAYRLLLNRNHTPAVQFVTLAHELAHLALGHTGPDRALRIPANRATSLEQCEIEAEAVAYLVARRQGIEPGSQRYLSSFVGHDTTIERLDVYQIMRAAGTVEGLLELGIPTAL